MMGKQVKTILPTLPCITSFPQDALLPAWSLDHAKRLRAGKGIAYDLKFRVPCQWEDGQEAEQWLKQGDMDKLSALLRKDPFRVAHPVIRAQLDYLQELLGGIEASDPVAELATNEPIYSTGTRQTARTALLKVFQGMWNSFSPGTLFVKLRKKRGSSKKWQDWEIESFLDDFNALMEHLKCLLLDVENEHQAYRGSQADYVKKITEFVRELHLLSDHSLDIVKRRNAQGEWCSTFVQCPISLKAARLIAQQAIPHKRVQKHILVAGLFAHHMLKDHTKWKRLHRIIERGEEMFPHLHRRKARTGIF